MRSQALAGVRDRGASKGSSLLRRVGSAALVSCLCMASAQAADKPHENTYEFTPFLGYSFGGEFEDPLDNSDRDVDEDTSFGLVVNIAADSAARQYELIYSQQSTQVDGFQPFDLDIQYLQIGGSVSHPDMYRVNPYFGMTVGATRLSPDAAGLDDETKLSFSAGGGLKVRLTDHFALRLDARAFVTLLDEETEVFCISAPPSATCRIRGNSDTFVQYSTTLGFTAGF